jgi:signal transduction histidine kinase
MKGLRPTAVVVCLVGCAVVEVGVFGWWLTSRSTLGFVVFQLLLLAVAAIVTLTFRYLRFRHRYEEAIATNAMLAERNRLAEEMHDILGHELSIIALRVGNLQVRTTGRTKEAAAEIRRDVERTVDKLRQTLSILRASPQEAIPEPVTEPIGAIIDRIRATGTAITLVGALPEHMPQPIDRTIYRLVREALTNATRHAPDQPITVRFTDEPEQIILTVSNPIEAGKVNEPEAAHEASGIESLQRRVFLVGGQLVVRNDGTTFTVTARLPRRAPVSPSTSPSTTPRPRRPLWATLLSALMPSAVAIAVVVGFYAWSVHDGATDDRTFGRISAGMSANAARALLPARQAPIRLVPSAPHEQAWDCSYYSDGNFPLGFAVFQVCYHDGAVVMIADLRKESWL